MTRLLLCLRIWEHRCTSVPLPRPKRRKIRDPDLRWYVNDGFDGEAFAGRSIVIVGFKHLDRVCWAEQESDCVKHCALARISATKQDIDAGIWMPIQSLDAPKFPDRQALYAW